MATPELPEFACPRCHGTLDADPERYQCANCGSIYPIVLGIPDFRVFPDPWLGFEEDRLKSIRLHSIIQGLSFADSVRAYWEITPSTPPSIAQRHIQHVLGSEQRASDWLDWLGQKEPAASNGYWIDIGCGAGDVVAGAGERGIPVIGIDIALRWLVVASRRDFLQHRTGVLVCANAEFLPFKTASFARAVSLGTLEHCVDPAKALGEAGRVLRSGGLLQIRTVNRYTLLPEPHVHVWGVGLVPRRFADAYVRMMSGQRYEHHRPLSPRGVRRALFDAGLSDVSIAAAELLEADRGRLGAIGALASPLYDRLRQMPVVGAGVRWIAPVMEARGIAP